MAMGAKPKDMRGYAPGSRKALESTWGDRSQVHLMEPRKIPVPGPLPNLQTWPALLWWNESETVRRTLKRPKSLTYSGPQGSALPAPDSSNVTIRLCSDDDCETESSRTSQEST
jgi:hypothetical protein